MEGDPGGTLQDKEIKFRGTYLPTFSPFLKNWRKNRRSIRREWPNPLMLMILGMPLTLFLSLFLLSLMKKEAQITLDYINKIQIPSPWWCLAVPAGSLSYAAQKIIVTLSPLSPSQLAKRADRQFNVIHAQDIIYIATPLMFLCCNDFR